MKTSEPDPAVVKQLQERIDRKIRDHEIASIQFWKERLDRIASMKPDGIASLQLEIRKISSMMENRISILKRENK